MPSADTKSIQDNSFSRSGFTSGYLNGKIDGTMFGVRSEADAELTKKTLPMLRELYRRERSRVPVTMRLEIEEGGEKLTVTDADGNKAFAYGDFEPQPARTAMSAASGIDINECSERRCALVPDLTSMGTIFDWCCHTKSISAEAPRLSRTQ